MWVPSQMEHVRGATQAQHIRGAPTARRDKVADVHMGVATIDGEPLSPTFLWHLRKECAKCAQAVVWNAVGDISGAINAFTNGKGEEEGLAGKGPVWGAGAWPKGDARAAYGTPTKTVGKEGDIPIDPYRPLKGP
jgi:hypothetical protein